MQVTERSTLMEKDHLFPYHVKTQNTLLDSLHKYSSWLHLMSSAFIASFQSTKALIDWNFINIAQYRLFSTKTS